MGYRKSRGPLRPSTAPQQGDRALGAATVEFVCCLLMPCAEQQTRGLAHTRMPRGTWLLVLTQTYRAWGPNRKRFYSMQNRSGKKRIGWKMVPGT